MLWSGGVKVVRGGMLFHRFPPFSIVQHHPIILPVLNLSGIFQGLCEQIPQIVVVGCLLKPQHSYIAQVLVEFLCH